MSIWSKIVLAVFFVGAMAFAQFDDEPSNDDSTEQSYSYGDDESASDEPAGEAKASGDQWEGFRYEDLGLTQWEFQQAKEEVRILISLIKLKFSSMIFDSSNFV